MMHPIKSAPPPSGKPKPDPRIAHLVGVARELGIKAGYEAGERLIDQFGAQRLYVPRKTRQRQPSKRNFLNDVDLVTALGLDVATALAELYGGEHIIVPPRSSLRRKRMIDCLLSTPALSINQVAAKFDVDHSTIKRLRAQLRRQAPHSASANNPLNGVAAAPLTRLSVRQQTRGVEATPRQARSP